MKFARGKRITPGRVLKWLAVSQAVTQAANLSTTVYLHRSQTHGSVELDSRASLPMRLALWLTTGIDRHEWVAVHRAHHQHTDVPGDPHSPVLLGQHEVVYHNAQIYRRWLDEHPERVDLIKRQLGTDVFDRLFAHGNAGLVVGIGIAVAVFGPVGGTIISYTHARHYLWGGGGVNGICHDGKPADKPHGYKSYRDNHARNVWWVAFDTCGEGWHNNHHHLQQSPRLGLHGGELDPGWALIRLLHRWGLADFTPAGQRAIEKLQQEGVRFPATMAHIGADS